MRPTVRGLVWDLDDTLWRGDTSLPSAGAVGTLHALDRRGILHAATGRRDHTVTLARHGLVDLFSVLDFGRDAKSGPVRVAASTLDIPLETIAVVSGDPVARAEVSAALPAVRCYPAAMVDGLPELGEFTPDVVTTNSRDRRHIVRAEQRRRTASTTHPGTSASFVASLGLELEVRAPMPGDLPVATGFTTTGRRLGPAELTALVDDPAHEVLTATLRDRFGPYGVVGFAVLAPRTAATAVELLMCERVLARGAGAAFLDHIVTRTLLAGLPPVAEFVPTPANRQLLVTLRFSGFEVTASTRDRMTLTLDPRRPPPPRHHPVRLVDG
ncbi:hypothetical protein [Actinophytocola gossypii]|uniref:HAD-IIIC family phosphatase n=1 Tax=Actinophytocola gossypii TaxID=2812003 RepID=A0ABT2JC57_9PSEU|nr:hypothetical protein [Actinophytocola gossypii]MCT2585448.1 hypothetical protein [Actinophytocola gossypii]